MRREMRCPHACSCAYHSRPVPLCVALAVFRAESFDGKVVSVADGDTITVLTDQKRQIKVRLYGIDCPESRQAFGNRARQFTSKEVFGKHVSVEVMDVDRYGRTVGIVTTADGTTLNRKLLRAGMAWLYTAYCKAPLCQKWKQLERQAQQAKVGLWADKNTVPPCSQSRTAFQAVFPLAFAQIDSSHSSIQSRRYHMRPLQLVQRGPVP